MEHSSIKQVGMRSPPREPKPTHVSRTRMIHVKGKTDRSNKSNIGVKIEDENLQVGYRRTSPSTRTRLMQRAESGKRILQVTLSGEDLAEVPLGSSPTMIIDLQRQLSDSSGEDQALRAFPNSHSRKQNPVFRRQASEGSDDGAFPVVPQNLIDLRTGLMKSVQAASVPVGTEIAPRLIPELASKVAPTTWDALWKEEKDQTEVDGNAKFSRGDDAISHQLASEIDALRKQNHAFKRKASSKEEKQLDVAQLEAQQNELSSEIQALRNKHDALNAGLAEHTTQLQLGSVHGLQETTPPVMHVTSKQASRELRKQLSQKGLATFNIAHYGTSEEEKEAREEKAYNPPDDPIPSFKGGGREESSNPWTTAFRPGDVSFSASSEPTNELWTTQRPRSTVKNSVPTSRSSNKNAGSSPKSVIQRIFGNRADVLPAPQKANREVVARLMKEDDGYDKRAVLQALYKAKTHGEFEALEILRLQAQDQEGALSNQMRHSVG